VQPPAGQTSSHAPEPPHAKAQPAPLHSLEQLPAPLHAQGLPGSHSTKVLTLSYLQAQGRSAAKKRRESSGAIFFMVRAAT
jgi:hypothetical protein